MKPRKHPTQGPWHVGTRDKFAAAEGRALQIPILRRIGGDPNQSYCVAWVNQLHHYNECDEANARLIAAAPTMLALLQKSMHHMVKNMEYFDPDAGPSLDKLVEDIESIVKQIEDKNE